MIYVFLTKKNPAGYFYILPNCLEQIQFDAHIWLIKNLFLSLKNSNFLHWAIMIDPPPPHLMNPNLSVPEIGDPVTRRLTTLSSSWRLILWIKSQICIPFIACLMFRVDVPISPQINIMSWTTKLSFSKTGRSSVDGCDVTENEIQFASII